MERHTPERRALSYTYTRTFLSDSYTYTDTFSNTDSNTFTDPEFHAYRYPSAFNSSRQPGRVRSHSY